MQAGDGAVGPRGAEPGPAALLQPLQDGGPLHPGVQGQVLRTSGARGRRAGGELHDHEGGGAGGAAGAAALSLAVTAGHTSWWSGGQCICVFVYCICVQAGLIVFPPLPSMLWLQRQIHHARL